MCKVWQVIKDQHVEAYLQIKSDVFDCNLYSIILSLRLVNIIVVSKY